MARRAPQAFTLIELMLVITIIAILAAMVMSALPRARESGRSATCLNNLHQIGVGLQVYVQDNGNRLPEMYDALLDTNGSVIVTNPMPNVVLSNYLSNAGIWRCPSDDKKDFEQTGSSYGWDSFINGQELERLNVFGRTYPPDRVPTFFDKEPFHNQVDVRNGVNYLYGDGHVHRFFDVEALK